MEVVHQDKESIPAARQSSKINQPTRVCLLYLIIREPNFYRSYKSLICPHIPRLAEAKTVTFPVGNSGKQMTASQLHHPLTKQSCIKLICCRSFICDWNNCQVPARGFRSLIKAIAFWNGQLFFHSFTKSLRLEEVWGRIWSNLLKARPALRSDQVAPCFSQWCLENLQEWRHSLPRQPTSFQRGRKRGNGPCQPNLLIHFQFKCLSTSRSSFYPPYSLKFCFTLISPYWYITTNDFIWFLGLTLLPFSH